MTNQTIKNITKKLTTKQKLMKSIEENPSLDYFAVKGFDNFKYTIEIKELTILTQLYNNRIIEEILIPTNQKTLKRALDYITQEEVKMVRDFNKISSNNQQKQFNYIQKAYFVDRDIKYSEKLIVELREKVENEILKLSNMIKFKESINYNQLKKMNEGLNNVGFYDNKDFYNKVNQFYSNY